MWHTEKFKEEFNSSLSLQEIVLQAGDNCYSGIRSSFRKGGYWRMLAACKSLKLNRKN